VRGGTSRGSRRRFCVERRRGRGPLGRTVEGRGTGRRGPQGGGIGARARNGYRR
jgi:hypothetical protein